MTTPRVLTSMLVLGLVASASATAQTHTRTEAITYNDNIAAWVIG